MNVRNRRVAGEVANANRSSDYRCSAGTTGNGSETMKMPSRIGELNDREIADLFVDGAHFVPLNAADS